jgi:hypothetical protein
MILGQGSRPVGGRGQGHGSRHRADRSRQRGQGQQVHDRRSALPVKETFQGKTVWEGTVHVFDLEEHPRATRAYALSHLVGETGERRRFFAVLHLGRIRSPVDAVRAAIVPENKGRR